MPKPKRLPLPEADMKDDLHYSFCLPNYNSTRPRHNPSLDFLERAYDLSRLNLRPGFEHMRHTVMDSLYTLATKGPEDPLYGGHCLDHMAFMLYRLFRILINTLEMTTSRGVPPFVIDPDLD